MNKLFELLEKHLMGPLSKLANTLIIRALMNAGLATVPFTIVSSIFLLINNLPLIIPPLADFFKATILNYAALYSGRSRSARRRSASSRSTWRITCGPAPRTSAGSPSRWWCRATRRC